MDPITPEHFSNFEIDIEALPRHEEVRLHPISRKYLIKLQVGTFFSFSFFAIALMVAYNYVPAELHQYFTAGGLVLLILFGWTVFNNIMYVKNSGYALREKDIVFQRGFLFRRTTVVPFNRIQHVSVERSFLDKMLGISTIKVFTAGGSGSDISIPGVMPSTATSVKEELSARIYNHA